MKNTEVSKSPPGCKSCEGKTNKTLLDQLTKQVLKLWPQDSTAEEEEKELTAEDRYCIQMMTKERRLVQGRYEMPVLWKPGEPDLPPNRPQAMKRLLSNERKWENDPEDWTAYNREIDLHLEKGYVEDVTQDSGKFYLPHFQVLRPDRSTTKRRTVFDCTTRAAGKALNDAVYPGPCLINDLNVVLLRFRRFPVVLAGDVKEMFLQIRLNERDAQYHHFLHRWSKGGEIREFCWRRHCMGNTCSQQFPSPPSNCWQRKTKQSSLWLPRQPSSLR